jgi:acyl carrier protein
MERAEIQSKLKEIFEDVFETEGILLKDETTAADISEWDSINHIYLIVEIEKSFKVKFTTHEIQTWKNVGEMIVSIENRMQK